MSIDFIYIDIYIYHPLILNSNTCIKIQMTPNDSYLAARFVNRMRLKSH